MEEIRKEFIRRVRMLVDFWELNEKCSSTRDRLEALAFSLLYLLDGKSQNMKEFTISTNRDLENNISGNLSDLYYELNEKQKC